MHRPRILFATPASPFGARSGAEQRSALILAGLRRVGQVDVLQLVQDEPKQAERLNEHGESWLRVTLQPPASAARYRADPSVARAVITHFGTAPCDYDLIVGRYLLPACQVAAGHGAPVLVDLDDLKYRYAPGMGWTLPVIRERLAKFAAHTLARRQLGRFEAAFFVSPLDQQEHPVVRSAVLRNVPWSPPAVRPIPSDGQELLFVGSLWYRPNAEGVDWFLRKVWPRVIEAVPEARLTLVGPASAEARQRWSAQRQVQAPGFVDDLAAAYASAAVVIAPIHSGGGTNIKVLEALAYGRPCVTTGFTWRALSDCLDKDRDILVADDAAAFARHCIAVLREPGRFEALASAGFETARRRFSRESFVGCVAEMAQSLLPEQGPAS